MAATHGKASTYRSRRRCRCDDCTRANTERARAERKARKDRLAADSTLAHHGTAATFINWGCRCDPCSEANAERCRQRKARRVS